MKNQRREFIKKAFAGTLAVSAAGTLYGFAKKINVLANKAEEKIVKKLIVRKIDFKGAIDLEIAEKLLEMHSEYQFIDTINWPSYAYKPVVKFKIAYCQNQIWLKFSVSEDTVRAKETKVNGAVCKDSCVEFFFSPNKDGSYYNFEFNCVGVPHVGYNSVKNKLLIDPENIKLIRVKSSLGKQPFEEKIGGYHWEMMVVIPKECFVYDNDLELKGLNATANFYKCGDETSTPHYLTWNPVGTKDPDYHQPKYFGELLFEK